MNEIISKNVLKESNRSSRFVSFDILRGFAIFFMVFIHSIMTSYDYSWIEQNPSIISDLPVLFIIIIAIIGYFGMWVSFFVILSASVNSYVMTKKAREGTKHKNILFKQILTGFLILLAGRLKNQLIGYEGYLGRSIIEGSFQSASLLWEGFWIFGPLDIIGLCIIITSVIHYLLMINSGYEKYIRNIIVYGILGVSVLVVTPFFSSWSDSIINSFEPFSLKKWFLLILVDAKDPIFPYLLSSFLGSILGIVLEKPENRKKQIILGGIILILILSIVSTILIIFNVANDFPQSILLKPPELPTYLFLTIGQIAMIMFVFGLIEFRGKATNFANNRFLRFIRLWSIISLTIFVIDIFQLFPS